MKNLTLIALTLLGVYSTASYAVEGGQTVKWSDYPYIVESDCTGTVLAGKYVLLAGHCGASVDNPFPRLVNFSNGLSMMPIHRNAEPFYRNKNSADVALWTLSESAPMDKIAFIANLNDNTNNVAVGDEISFLGFGQDSEIPKLEKAVDQVTWITSNLTTSRRFNYDIGKGHSVEGDSGAPVFNKNNLIIGIDTVGASTEDGGFIAGGELLNHVKDWLLKGVNAWHSPTELKFTGDKTINIQSLHVNPVNLETKMNEGTLASGDVAVTGGTCVTDGDVSPFGTCSLDLKAGEGEGHIMLDDGNTVTINRAPKPEPTPIPQPSGNKSGGSLGWLGLLGLLAVAFKRKELK